MRRRLSFLLIAIALSGAVQSVYAQIPPSKQVAVSGMNHEFKLENSSIKLLIPEGYVVATSNSVGDIQRFLVLVAYLPDLLPRYLADQRGGKVNGKVISRIELPSEAEIQIEIRASSPDLISKLIEDIKKNKLLNNKGEKGFLIYNDKYLPNPAAGPIAESSSEYLIPTDLEDSFLHCGVLPATGARAGCRANFQTEERVIIAFSFNAVLLQNYREIKEKVTTLVKSFISDK